MRPNSQQSPEIKKTLLDQQAVHIHIVGIVQGVGFRPFVYKLAMRNSLTGWVRNSSSGVDIVLEGSHRNIDRFVQELVAEKPALAAIDDITQKSIALNGFDKFEIIPSQEVTDAFQPISPDVSICPDCLRELFDPLDLRFLYPFTNCTNCGPRFTIIKAIPYDRPNTTMDSFKMCAECDSQYRDPADRRFHAQPVACPNCGPQVWLETNRPHQQSVLRGKHAIRETQQLLKKGAIVAIKGLGGFHLACDAINKESVEELRRRKLRVDKPFALMMPDIQTINEYCFLNQAEQSLLESRERPIVILKRRPGSFIAEAVAPNQDTLGVMLPYSPLHYLLFHTAEEINQAERFFPGNDQKTRASPAVLVMTSGNLSEEPIATDNQEARERLTSLADAFLMHDRPIHIRTDDSVARAIHLENRPDHQPFTKQLLRRSRGYAPAPIRLPWRSKPILATGAELKNTFCLVRDRYAFLSHHIGDLENYETLSAFEDGIRHFEEIFLIHPQIIAYDQHPDYLATRYALDRAHREGLPAIAVQHHHAHIAACMLEHSIPTDMEVIGVAFDGTGYGDDGAIWGGEFMLANYHKYQRCYHLAYTPLPGGDKAVREPWRMALAYLDKAGIDWSPDLPPVQHVLEKKQHPDRQFSSIAHQIHTGLNSPPTSSTGRFFDAVSSLIGIRQEVNYEAQAAIEMEQLIDPEERHYYPFFIPSFEGKQQSISIDTDETIRALVRDITAGTSPGIMAARFHRGLANMICQVCIAMRNSFDSNIVALSGGVWQNLALLSFTHQLLQKEGFSVLLHEQIPPNDGGIAVGQAVVAINHFQS